MSWRRILGQRVRRLSKDEAQLILSLHARRGPGVEDPEYRRLTGGFSSQAIDNEVTRKLAVKAELRVDG